MLNKHPIEQEDYLVPTAELVSFHNNVKDTLDLKLHGTIIYAGGGTGKSTAIRYSSERIKEEMGDEAPAVLVSILGENIGYQPKAFFNELTGNWEKFEAIKRSATLEKIKDAVIAYLTYEGLSHNGEILLYIDEAQGMSTDNLLLLMYISNRLHPVGVNITYILVGQKTLMLLRHALMEERGKHEHIIRRFMNTEHEMHAIRTLDDMIFFFSSHDILTYEGQTYTEYFFPKGCAKGKKFSGEADVLYSVLMEESGLAKLPEITMHEMTTIIRYVMITGKRNNSSWPKREDWVQIVEKLDLGKKLKERSLLDEIESLSIDGLISTSKKSGKKKGAA